MTRRRLVTNVVSWLVVAGFWVVVARDHHPTWTIDALATLLLVGASAAAFYANDLALWPKLARRGAWASYALALAGVVLALDLVAVFAIQAVYDALWGPDPARYGIGTNVALEAIFICVHLAAATAVAALARRARRGRSETSARA